MGNAKYIGRVGALAVALGIGVAIAAAPGMASADTDTQSSETASAGSEQSGGPVDSRGSGDDKAAGRDGEAKADETETDADADADADSGRRAGTADAHVDVDRHVGAGTDVDDGPQPPDEADGPVETADIGGTQRQTVALTAPAVDAEEGKRPTSPSRVPPRPVDPPFEVALAAAGTRQRQPATAATATALSTAQAASATSVAPVPVGTNPTAIAIGTASDSTRVYVANTGSNSVSVIDAVTNQRIDANASTFTKDIKVGSAPSALTLSADGRLLYVANRSSNSVSVIDAATFTRIDANASTFSKDIKVGSAPSALTLSADGRLLYVANRSSNSVSVIDAATFSVAHTITVGSQPSSVTLGTDERLYATNTGSGTVSVIDTATNTVIDTDPDAAGTNSISVGPSPSSVALSPDGALAYVANANDTVSAIDTTTNTVVGTVVIDSDTTGGHVIAVSPDGTIYVTDAADRTVRVLTIGESTGVSAIGNVTVTGQRPGSLVLSANDTRAVLITSYPIGPVTFGSYPDGIYGSRTRVAVIDTVSGSQVGTTFTMDGLQAPVVQLSADGTRALITSRASSTRVAVLDTTTGTQVGTTFTLSGGGSAQFVANGSRALVTADAYSSSTNSITTRVAVLNTATGAQAGATLAVAGSASVAMSPDGAHALVFSDAKVVVLNAITGTATTSALTGSWNVERWSADGSRALISNRITDATTRLAVIDTTTATQTGTTLTVIGSGSVQFGPDGTHALVIAKETSAGSTTTRIALFNTAAGNQIGTTLVLTGDGSVEYSPDATRALVTTDVYDAGTASHTTRVTMFSTITGTQTGTLSLTGSPYNRQPVFSPDGTRALITTTVYDSATTLHTSRVTMFDTATGSQIGTTLALTGPEVAGTTWRGDGARALVTMIPTQYNSVTFPTFVAVIDKAGNQIGTTLTLSGMPSYGDQPVWNLDDTRVLITTSAYNSVTGISTTQVTTINTTTGTPVGTPVTLTSGAFGGRTVWVPNENRAIITAGDQVALIDAGTGTQTGATMTTNGIPSAPVFSADGSRALITTATSVTVFDTTTGTQTGSTLIPASPRPVVALLTADGTHALVTSDYRHFFTPGVLTAPVAVIDLATGTQIGTALSLIGDTYASPAFTLGGTRALIATVVDDPANGVSTTRVTTINTTTGTPTGTTVTLSGALASGVGDPLQVVLSSDGTRALVATNSNPGGSRTSHVAVIDTVTGTQIGDTVTVNGALSGLRWSTDGTRVFVTTYITTASGADLSIRATVLEVL